MPWDLVTEKVSDEQLDKIEDLREQFTTLCAKVDWADLFGNEMIYAGRLSPTITNGSPYEGLLIGRAGSAKKAAANVENLKAILDEVAKLIEAESGDQGREPRRSRDRRCEVHDLRAQHPAADHLPGLPEMTWSSCRSLIAPSCRRPSAC